MGQKAFAEARRVGAGGGEGHQQPGILKKALKVRGERLASSLNTRASTWPTLRGIWVDVVQTSKMSILMLKKKKKKSQMMR